MSLEANQRRHFLQLHPGPLCVCHQKRGIFVGQSLVCLYHSPDEQVRREAAAAEEEEVVEQNTKI